MDERWISAHDAFSRLSGFPGVDAAAVICARAADGLIETRASEYFEGKRRTYVSTLPKEFWRSSGFNSLKKNWATGDFESWIDVTKHCRAYGVTFREADIERIVAGSLRSGKSVAERTAPRGGRGRSEKWNSWIIELVMYIHEEGLPPGSDAGGQDKIISAIDARLRERGLEGLSRTTVQSVVRELLLRLRTAGR